MKNQDAANNIFSLRGLVYNSTVYIAIYLSTLPSEQL